MQKNIQANVSLMQYRKKNSYFRYNTLDLNPVGASDIAKDKDYATFFMKKMGYPTIVGKTFFSNEWAKAIGLNVDQFKKDMEAPETAAQVTQDMKEAGEVGVRGTPSFFIDGKQPAGRSFELYKSIIDENIKNAPKKG